MDDASTSTPTPLTLSFLPQSTLPTPSTTLPLPFPTSDPLTSDPSTSPLADPSASPVIRGSYNPIAITIYNTFLFLALPVLIATLLAAWFSGSGRSSSRTRTTSHSHLGTGASGKPTTSAIGKPPSKKRKRPAGRSPTWYSFIISWLIFVIASLLLVGEQRSVWVDIMINDPQEVEVQKDGKFYLCLVQASVLGGARALVTLTTLALLISLYQIVTLTLFDSSSSPHFNASTSASSAVSSDGKSPGPTPGPSPSPAYTTEAEYAHQREMARKRRWWMITLVSVPYVTFVGLGIGGIVHGLMFPGTVEPQSTGMYCHFGDSIMTLISSSIILLTSIITFILLGMILTLIYWLYTPQQKRQIVPMVWRLVVVVVGGVVSVGLSFISVFDFNNNTINSDGTTGKAMRDKVIQLDMLSNLIIAPLPLIVAIMFTSISLSLSSLSPKLILTSLRNLPSTIQALRWKWHPQSGRSELARPGSPSSTPLTEHVPRSPRTLHKSRSSGSKSHLSHKSGSGSGSHSQGHSRSPSSDPLTLPPLPTSPPLSARAFGSGPGGGGFHTPTPSTSSFGGGLGFNPGDNARPALPTLPPSKSSSRGKLRQGNGNTSGGGSAPGTPTPRTPQFVFDDRDFDFHDSPPPGSGPDGHLFSSGLDEEFGLGLAHGPGSEIGDRFGDRLWDRFVEEERRPLGVERGGVTSFGRKF